MESQNKKWELLISPRRPLADKFLYRALVRVNAYKCAKFQLPITLLVSDIKMVS